MKWEDIKGLTVQRHGKTWTTCSIAGESVGLECGSDRIVVPLSEVIKENA